MQDLKLGSRDGLPDHLRILLEEFPRETWEAHSNFNGLTKFWMDRHLMFRRIHSRMLTDTQEFLDRKADPERYGVMLYRLANAFIGELHGHHHVEDEHYFPLLSGKDARLQAAFELLDKDHHALDPLLGDLTTRTNDVLRALQAGEPANDAAGRFHEAVDAFGGFLDRHLTDEEDIVVPVILKHGADGLG